jgi:SAM-dependent methyltransferase
MTDNATASAAGKDQPWFATWFDSDHYHKLYAYHDDREAADFIDKLHRQLRPAPASRVLDLGCGTGRHSKYLASLGFDVTGLDLASSSIRQARRFQQRRLRFFRHDMRVPFGSNRYDYIFSFFTSFGYFESTSQHVKVIANVADALKPGGRFVLDYLNAEYAEAQLTAHDVHETGDAMYKITRWSDAGHFYKQIVIEDSRQGVSTHVERVAKFTRNEFKDMAEGCGLSIEDTFGDYRLRPYCDSTSPRLVVVMRKPAASGRAFSLPLLPGELLANTADCFG